MEISLKLIILLSLLHSVNRITIIILLCTIVSKGFNNSTINVQWTINHHWVCNFNYTRIFWRYVPKKPSPCTWPNAGRACMQAMQKIGAWPSAHNYTYVTRRRPCTHASTCKRSLLGGDQHYKSTQDILLGNFHFLHYTQILHCLKDQYWAFGPPLWASGPILISHNTINQLRIPSWETFIFFTTPKFCTV